MTMREYFESLQVGERVSKRGLAYLKRIGMIWNYSSWGYLESATLLGKHREGEPFRDRFILEISPNKTCIGAEKIDWSESTFDDMLKFFGSQGKIEIFGCELRPKYYDGCFKPFLVKC